MPRYRRPTGWNHNGLRNYNKQKHNRITRDEHKRRVRNRIDLETIPNDWDEFKLLSEEDQLHMAKVLSVMISLFDYARTDFITGVIMEYEFQLASYWGFVCEDCGFPDGFCSSL